MTMLGDLDALQLDDLFKARDHTEEQLAKGKTHLAEINAAIRELLAGPVIAAYERAGKAGGTVLFAFHNRMYRSEIDKSVKWDNEILGAVASDLPPDTLKISYTIEEKVFSNLDPVARSLAVKARTVRYSEPKISPA